MVNGFIVVDKPAGITSHDVVNRIRRIAGTKRVGHTGTLDPFATGVLPIAINEGTKAIPFLDEGEKGYQALVRFGVRTDTLDMTGTVLEELDYSGLDRAALLSAISGFVGEISQIPPMFSAIKQNGQPLYKLARKGVEVERKARQVTINSLELAGFDPPLAELVVSCSRGTYIRTLADDLGKKLGCGASLTALRRTHSGPFSIDDALSLEEIAALAEAGRLEDAVVSPLRALCHIPVIRLLPEGVERVQRGMAPRIEHLDGQHSEMAAGLCCLSRDKRLVAVAEFGGDWQAREIIVLKRVFNG